MSFLRVEKKQAPERQVTENSTLGHHSHVANSTRIANAEAPHFTSCYNARANAPCLMILELKLRKVGNSVGLLLPRAALDHLGVGSSGSLFVTSMPDGALRISALDPEFAQKVKAAETSMQEYVNTFKWFMSREPKPAAQTAPSAEGNGNKQQQ
jgi:antitoxin component of MazEF toxin-antitoxin module